MTKPYKVGDIILYNGEEVVITFAGRTPVRQWNNTFWYNSFDIVKHNGKYWRSERSKDPVTQATPLEVNVNREPCEGSLFWKEIPASVAE